MASELLNVVFKLNEIICHEEGDGIGSAEPYLWAIFFKIDGQSVQQNGISLVGEAGFFFSHGSHHNLPNHDVDPGEIVPIPAIVGEWSTTLSPIQLEDFSGNQFEVPGIIGAIAVLMEEDNVSDSGAEAGHQALNNHIRDAINEFIASISLLEFVELDVEQAEDLLQQKIDELIASIKANVSDVVRDAIRTEQNIFEDIWSFLNADDQIGNQVWTFSAEEIKEQDNLIALNERWENHGDWEINGEISASVLCPAKAISEESVSVLQRSLDLEKLGRFEKLLYKKYPKATPWWLVALRNSPFVIAELRKDKETTRQVVQAITLLEKHLEDDQPLSSEFFRVTEQVIGKFAKSPFSRLKRDARMAKPLLKNLKGKSLAKILDYLSKNKPSRSREVLLKGKRKIKS
ncbi:MAG: hypothetical protein ACREJ0_08770 [Geminicoccaceae bacterium]